MNPALRSSAAHVFVQSLAALELQPDDAHHLFRVLRVRDGDVAPDETHHLHRTDDGDLGARAHHHRCVV